MFYYALWVLLLFSGIAMCGGSVVNQSQGRSKFLSVNHFQTSQNKYMPPETTSNMKLR